MKKILVLLLAIAALTQISWSTAKPRYEICIPPNKYRENPLVYRIDIITGEITIWHFENRYQYKNGEISSNKYLCDKSGDSRTQRQNKYIGIRIAQYDTLTDKSIWDE